MTPQAQAWAGAFGDAYLHRNHGNVVTNRKFFRRIFSRAMLRRPHSILELGCGAGENLDALRQGLDLQSAHIEGVEINETAVAMARSHGHQVTTGDLLSFSPTRTYELVFTKGLLIHIAPDHLPRMYDLLAACSSRWVLIAEYYNPTPVDVVYRGLEGLLHKRDFAGEFLDRHHEFTLVDYGFAYHRDEFPQDDLHWFLMSNKEQDKT